MSPKSNSSVLIGQARTETQERRRVKKGTEIATKECQQIPGAGKGEEEFFF